MRRAATSIAYPASCCCSDVASGRVPRVIPVPPDRKARPGQQVPSVPPGRKAKQALKALPGHKVSLGPKGPSAQPAIKASLEPPDLPDPGGRKVIRATRPILVARPSGCSPRWDPVNRPRAMPAKSWSALGVSEPTSRIPCGWGRTKHLVPQQKMLMCKSWSCAPSSDVRWLSGCHRPEPLRVPRRQHHRCGADVAAAARNIR